MIYVSAIDPLKDFAGVPAKVREGAEVIVEDDRDAVCGLSRSPISRLRVTAP